MARSTIDPVTRIEGHLRIEMEVEDGKVVDAWSSAGLFRGMELILENRTSDDAIHISQRICGVCPVSHANAAAIAGEQARGMRPAEGGRIVRNLTEYAQFLYSNITWFYILNGLDYISPINAVKADPAEAARVAAENGLATADFGALQSRLAAFAENGQLSIFSGNWFDTTDADGSNSYKLSPELDLIMTAHYFEALTNQSKAAQINGVIGGKMPHITTGLVGGTAFVPDAQKVDDIKFRFDEINSWVANHVMSDAVALAKAYGNGFEYGKSYGNYIAWGVFESPSFDSKDRALPSGVLTAAGDDWDLDDVDPRAITEDTTHAYYKAEDDNTPVNPLEGRTHPWFPGEGYNTDHKYSWCKAPRYNGKPYEAGSIARVLVAYKRGVSRIVELVDQALDALGQKGNLHYLESVMGRVVARACETVYLAEKASEEANNLIEYMANGGDEWYAKPTVNDGTGEALWEAPRGALYHMETVKGGNIKKYQIIIPSTWNLSPRDDQGTKGPLEQALIGTEVTDIEKPIKALRLVHSFDPCTACSVHVFEPKTGKSFTTLESPWGVR